MNSALRSFAVLGLLACASDDPTKGGASPEPTEPTEPSEPVVSTDGSTEVPVLPRGVATVSPVELGAQVDTAVLVCDGDEAIASVDLVGQADRIELDLVTDAVTPVAMTRSSTDEDEVWRTYEGATACDASVGATMVIRSFRGADQLDCAVFGPQVDEVLAGQLDELLTGAGRPGAEGCHNLSGH
jgi:hypothetical protein